MKTPSAFRTAVLAATLALVPRPAAPQVVTTLAGSGANGAQDGVGAEASFWYPSFIAVDAAGNVYVADRDNNKIRKITPSGTVSTSPVRDQGAERTEAARPRPSRSPDGVAVDLSGVVYVTEESYWSQGSSDADVRRITSTGDVTTAVTLHQEVMSISGMAVDRSGNLYVADYGDGADGGQGKILRVTPAGTVTTLAGRSDAGPSLESGGDRGRLLRESLLHGPESRLPRYEPRLRR